MKIFVFITLFVFINLFTYGQTHDINDQVILVQLELNEKLLVPSYWNSIEIENKRILLHLSDEDPLVDIESIEEDNDEDTKNSLNCFIPNVKLIYKDYTYLLSSLCNKVKKFENIQPFVASDKELPCSLTYSNGLSREIEKYKAIFFGPSYKSEYDSFAKRNQSIIIPNNEQSNVDFNSQANSIQSKPDDDEPEEIEEEISEEDNDENSVIGTATNEEMNEEDEDMEEEDFEEEEEEEEVPKKKKR